MLKLRILPVLLYKNPTLVKGISFDSWRRVGSVMQAIKVYNMREVDELIFVDITASQENRRPDFELIDEIADECFMPFTVGGGVKTIDDIRELLKVGADKVSINSSAVTSPELITIASDKFGAQCIVVSIDYKRINGKDEVYINSGNVATGLDLINWARKVEKLGAGEILLTSIDRDGTMSGYDVETLKKVTEAVNIPIIASGGCGSYSHMLECVITGSASAIAAASIFHFTEQTPKEAKAFLSAHGIPVRL